VKEFFRTLNDSWILRKFRRSSGRKDSPPILGMIEESSRWVSITRLAFSQNNELFSRKRKERIHTTTAASMESATHRYSGYSNSSDLRSRTFGEVSGGLRKDLLRTPSNRWYDQSKSFLREHHPTFYILSSWIKQSWAENRILYVQLQRSRWTVPLGMLSNLHSTRGGPPTTNNSDPDHRPSNFHHQIFPRHVATAVYGNIDHRS
jgi:hypothetical protein